MRKLTRDVAVAAAAGVVVLLITVLVDGMSLAVQLIIIAAALCLAFGAAHFLWRESADGSPSDTRTNVGTNIRTDSGAAVRDVTAFTQGEGASIGSDITAGEDVVVERIRVDGREADHR